MLSSVPGSWIWIAPLLLLAWPQGRGKLPPLEPFQGNMLEAQALAQERNVPLLLVTLYEEEGFDPKVHHDVDGLRRDLLSDPEVARAYERGLLALACNRVHELETVKVVRDGEPHEVTRCSAYHTDSCSVHQRLFEDVFATWNEDGALISPFVILQDTSGKVVERWSDSHTPSIKVLLASTEALRKQLGAGLTQAELLAVRSSEADARAAETRGDPGAAWRAWAAVLEVAEATPHATRARAGQPAALALFEERRSAALATVEAGQVVAGYDALLLLVEQSADTPLERDLKKELRTLETHPEHKPVIAAHKRELEAGKLLDEVGDLLRAGEERKARSRLAQLLRKFADTRAAAQGRERYPQLLN